MASAPVTPVRQRDGVTAHTPDPTAYHELNADQSSHMRGGRGLRGVMIPRARTFGGSQGFDTRPGVVNIIDMDQLGGRHVGTLDMEQLNPALLKQAWDQSGGDDLTALALLAEAQASRAEPMQPVLQRSNPTMPGRYVVPQSTLGGAQLNTEATMPEAFNPSTIPTNPSVKSTRRPQPPVSPVQGPTYDSSPQPNYQEPIPQPAQSDHLLAMLLEMRAKLDAITPIPQPSASIADYSVQPFVQQHTLPTPSQGASAAFASLGLDFLTPEPSKPKQKVYFNLGTGGKFAAYYHGVVQHQLCLALIYDTRYESGSQYLPPYRPEGLIELTVEATGKTYNVYSQECLLPLGKLDLCLLVIAESKDPSPVAAGAAPSLQDVLPGTINVEDQHGEARGY